MTAQENIKQQLLDLKASYNFPDLVWIWNDVCEHYEMTDKFIPDTDEDLLWITQEEVDAQIDIDLMVKYIIEVKYWEAMPELIKAVTEE